jgi:hypothetical protein
MSAGGAAGWSSYEPSSCYSSLHGGTSMSAGGAAGWSSCEPPAVTLAYLGEPPCLRVGPLAGAAVSLQLLL